MGDHCTVNPYTAIYGHGGVQIGNQVRIATHVVIVPANHVFSDPDQPIHQQGVTSEGITIEDDVPLGRLGSPAAPSFFATAVMTVAYIDHDPPPSAHGGTGASVTPCAAGRCIRAGGPGRPTSRAGGRRWSR
ncbi:hypothetical protein GCM10028833_28160 [Glycomyces tarimensis]